MTRVPTPLRPLIAGTCALLLCACIPSLRPLGAQPNRAARQSTLETETTGHVVQLKLRDGSTMFGTLVRADNDSLVLDAIAGRMAFARHDVSEVVPARVHITQDGTMDYWFENPSATRMLFGPTGRTLRGGEGYFGVHELMLGSLMIGVTDWFTIGASSLLIPSSRLWLLSPKIGLVRGETWNVAVGAMGGAWGGSDVGGIAYFATTYGSADHSVTLGFGRTFSGGTLHRETTVMLGTEQRLTRRVSFVSENYLFPGGTSSMISYGLRFSSEKLAYDVAFLNDPSHMVAPGVPYLAMMVKF
ncbi:MAG: hypothetical protein HY275_18840 [Gemmatimonadetes bacterium]|nr:hypothetical protein [Gemmatimonadota bacterium]